MADLRFIVFDCDGTLVDSQYMIVAAMAEAFAHHDIALADAAAVRRVVGLSLPEAVARLLPEADPRVVLSIAERYKLAFRQAREAGGQEPLYDGAAAAVRALAGAGHVLGVATGKSRRGLTAVLDLHGLASCFTTLQTADDAPGKPHPAMLEQAMAAVGAEPHETLMVGDTSYDVIMAHAAGVRSIGVAWGYHPPEELIAHGVDVVIENYDALIPAIDRLFEPAALGVTS